MFKKVYDFEQDEDFGTFSSATADQIKAFAAGREHPDYNCPHWDMRGSPSSAWNEAVVELLTDRLIAKLEKKQPPPFPQSLGVIGKQLFGKNSLTSK
jgi:hypothetical protein